MFRKLGLVVALSLWAGSAFAACTNPLAIKDGSAATIQMSVSTNADGFCQYNFNMAQINGVVPLMGNGATGTGSSRVTIANDNTIPTGWPTAALQTSGNSSLTTIATNSGTQATAALQTSGNSSLTTIATNSGTQATAANQATGNASLATIATNSGSPVPINLNTVTTAQTGLTPGASATAQTGTIVAANQDLSSVAGVALGVPANFGTAPAAIRVPGANAFNFVTDQVGGAAAALVGDPCQTTAKTTVTFTLATAAVKVAITGVSAKRLYICAFELNNNAADSIAVFEATTGTTCATAAAALVGAGTSVATAGTGYNFAANGGITRGNGAAQVFATLTNAADLCIAQSAATQLTGSFTYVAR